MSSHLPIIVVELLLVLGSALGFGWWQLRELKKLRQQRRNTDESATQPMADDEPSH